MVTIVPLMATADVARTVSVDMISFSNIEYTKTKTYTGNETNMFRTQVDNRFGSVDGVLTPAEVETFRSNQENYSLNPANFNSDPLYNFTNNLIFDNEMFEIFAADFTVKNLTGAYNETAVIETCQVKNVKVYNLSSEVEHVINVMKDIWEYNDLGGSSKETVGNNITITVPEGWLIDKSTVPGIRNKVYSDGNRTVSGNGYPLGSVWLRFYKEGHGPEPGDGMSRGEAFPWAFWGGLASALVIFAILWVAFDNRSKKSESTIERNPEFQALSLEKLTQKKEDCTAEILGVRAELQDDEISKTKAREKEKQLKERFKALQRELESRE
jgi:hypothetical protein